MNLDDMEEVIGSPVAIRLIEREPAPLLVNRTATRMSAGNAAKRYIVKQESPRQRLVVELASAGKTNKEIAEITGYSPITVSALLRQPATQQVLVDEIRARVDRLDEEVLQIVKEGCLESAKRLLKIVRNDAAKGSDHIAAANTFLDRRYGKANQPINSSTNVDLNNLSDAELAKQLTPTLRTGTDDSAPIAETNATADVSQRPTVERV